MKKIGLIIAILAIISCKEETKIDYAIVSGKIANKVIDGVNFTSSDNRLIKTILLSEDGSFVDTIKVAEGSFILTDGTHKANLYLSPGDNVVVNYDVKDFNNTLSFSGTGSETSNYWLAKIKIVKDIMGEGTEVYLLDEVSYKTKMAEIKNSLNKLLDAGTGFTEVFIAKEKKHNNYAYLANIEKYQSYHGHYAQLEDFKVSDDFLNELEGFDYSNEEDFIKYEAYKNLVVNYYSKEAGKLSRQESITNEMAFLKVVNTIKNETIKNELAYVASKYIINYTKELENFYKAFMDISTNEDHRDDITKSYNKLKTTAKE
tara:strand:+ start:797 stop:1747 length:951 start_codon:yes stop_codon:yes gene_type:complete